VGALTTTDFRFGARPWELQATASLCSQCPVGCNTTINARREAVSGGAVVIKRIMPRQNEEVNEIWICDKGRFAYHYGESQERLSKPLVRKDGKLARSSWDAATRTAGGAFTRARRNLLVLASGRLSNEDLFNLKALADQTGGKAVLYSGMGGGDLTTRHGMGNGSNRVRCGRFDDRGGGADLYQGLRSGTRVKQAAERRATLIMPIHARQNWPLRRALCAMPTVTK
jgi:NADH-quinone oxidoreductase subunit G